MTHHTHDCERCTHLGSDTQRDYYTCGSSLIIRDGSEGPDYQSLPIHIAQKIEAKEWQIACLLHWVKYNL